MYGTLTSVAMDVNGKLLDERRFPVPNVRIYISYGNSAITDKNGEFKVTTDKNSYDLTILDTTSNTGVVYRNLSSQNPELTFFGSASSRYINTEIVKVEFTPVPGGRSAIIKFISDKIFYSQDVSASSGEKVKLITVDFPSYTSSINGRIIYIEKTSSSYERYSERSVTINKDSYPQSVYFDSLSYFKNPGSSYVTVFLPSAEYQKKGFSVYADFLSLHINAELLLNTTEGDIISTKVLVPGTLPFGYRLKITGTGTYKGGSYFENYFYSYPGSSYNITNETPCQLDSPQDKSWGVGKNTRFAFDWGSGTGIYVLHFHAFDPVGDLYLVTTDRDVQSPLGYSAGVLKGDEYSWSVSKYTTYLSVDDFVKVKNFSNDIGYKSISTSELRTFRTKF